MNSFDCGRYRSNKLLLGFTLKRVGSKLKVINKHMKGLVWLAWKFLWQQLAAIGEAGEGTFNPDEAFSSMFKMHHTAVLAALQDFRSVRKAMAEGGRRRCSKGQMMAETYRVYPFVEIHDEKGLDLKYTEPYKVALNQAGVTLCEDIVS